MKTNTASQLKDQLLLALKQAAQGLPVSDDTLMEFPAFLVKVQHQVRLTRLGYEYLSTYCPGHTVIAVATQANPNPFMLKTPPECPAEVLAFILACPRPVTANHLLELYEQNKRLKSAHLADFIAEMAAIYFPKNRPQ